jgi:hypothetical protein
MEKRELGGRMGRNRELRLGKMVRSEVHGEASAVDRVLDCCPIVLTLQPSPASAASRQGCHLLTLEPECL